MEEFYIEAGVHRCVAAREAGLDEIPAILHREGCPDVLVVVRLESLHSKRAVVVGQKTRRRDLPGLIAAMADEGRRGRVPPVELQPLGAYRQPKTIPLRAVRIGDHEEDVR